MKVRVVKRGDKFFAEFKPGWFRWITISHIAPGLDWLELTEFNTEQAALNALKERFQTEVVFEGEFN